MAHSLIEIPRFQWINLRNIYCQRRKDASAYALLQNYINWVTVDSQINVKIYSLDGKWEDDGTFVLVDPDTPIIQVFFNTLTDNLERIITALNCLNKKETYLLFGFQERFMPAVQQHLQHVSSNPDNIAIDGTVWYHIDKEQAVQFDIKSPEGFTLSPLKKEHAEQVNSIWPHNAPGSIQFVERLILFNDNIGVFDTDGNLLAWCLRAPIGSLGLLQVIDTYKRKGFGSLVVRYMAYYLANKGEETMAPVVITNLASRSMFEKLGFKAIDKVYWSLKPAEDN